MNAATSKTAVAAPRPLTSSLPEDVVFAFPYHARADRPVTSKAGKTFRRTLLEFLDGNAGQTLRSVKFSMKAAGFAGGRVTLLERGVKSATFRKPGYGSVRVLVTSANKDASDMQIAGAKGVLRIDWLPAPAKA